MKSIALALAFVLSFSLSGCATYINHIIKEQYNKEHNFYSLTTVDKRIGFESIADVEASCDGVKINAAHAVILALENYTNQKGLQLSGPKKVDLFYKPRPSIALFIRFYAENNSLYMDVRYADIISEDKSISQAAKQKAVDYIKKNNFPTRACYYFLTDYVDFYIFSE